MEIQYRESPQIELNSNSKKSIERVKVVIHKWSNANNFTAIKMVAKNRGNKIFSLSSIHFFKSQKNMQN